MYYSGPENDITNKYLHFADCWQNNNIFGSINKEGKRSVLFKLLQNTLIEPNSWFQIMYSPRLKETVIKLDSD